MDINMDKRDWAKDMVKSVVAYSPVGLTGTPAEILDSYSGRTYLTQYVEMFGTDFILNLIAQEQERIDYITPPNDDGYVSVYYKNNEQWRYPHDKNNT